MCMDKIHTQRERTPQARGSEQRSSQHLVSVRPDSERIMPLSPPGSTWPGPWALSPLQTSLTRYTTCECKAQMHTHNMHILTRSLPPKHNSHLKCHFAFTM
jgi:hypothetical protein